MLSLTPGMPIFFCTTCADMRRSFDGLARLAEEHLARSVLSGGLFVFVNKRHDRLKLLWFDGDGYCLFYKRLEEGRFEVPQAADGKAVTLSATELAMILGGIELASARRRQRYQRPA